MRALLALAVAIPIGALSGTGTPNALAQIPTAATPPAAAAAPRADAISPAVPSATVELPDTPAGRRAAEMLRLTVEGDDATLRTYIQESFAPRFRDAFPIEEHLRIHAQMREESGGYDAVEVRESEPAEIQVVVRGRRTGELRLRMLRTETEPPHGIDGMGLRPLMPADGVEAPAVPDRALSDDEIASLLGDYLDRLVAADAFSGSVLLARGGQPVFEGAWGEATP